MSTVYNQDQDQVESANDGFENRIGVVVQNNVEEDVDNEGDESDDYGDDEVCVFKREYTNTQDLGVLIHILTGKVRRRSRRR